MILVGLALAAAACVGLSFGLGNVATTVVAIAVFDAGLFTAQVANQTGILAIDPTAPARFNGAYMLVYFIGGSIGTALGAGATARIGWTATMWICVAAVCVAAVLTGIDGDQDRSVGGFN